GRVVEDLLNRHRGGADRRARIVEFKAIGTNVRGSPGWAFVRAVETVDVGGASGLDAHLVRAAVLQAMNRRVAVLLDAARGAVGDRDGPRRGGRKQERDARLGRASHVDL